MHGFRGDEPQHVDGIKGGKIELLQQLELSPEFSGGVSVRSAPGPMKLKGQDQLGVVQGQFLGNAGTQ